MTTFREALPEDDAALTELIALPMPGDLSLSFCRAPSYLESCQRCGPSRRVLVAVQEERVVAMCSFYLREYHWHGQPRAVWMLGDFRALPGAAGRSITGQGWRAIRGLLGGHPALISVVEENDRALRLFSKPRRGWPHLHPVGDLRTEITPLGFRPRGRHAHSVRWVEASRVVEHVQAHRRPLSPLVEEADFGSVLPLRGRFWGVFDRADRMVGCAGLSEPWLFGGHRQVVVAGYGGVYRWLYRLQRLLRGNWLPNPGDEVRSSTAVLLDCPDPAAFRALFHALQLESQEVGSQFLVWNRPDPEHLPLWDRLRFRYRSRFYQLLWEGDQPLPPIPSPIGYELSWL